MAAFLEVLLRLGPQLLGLPQEKDSDLGCLALQSKCFENFNSTPPPLIKFSQRFHLLLAQFPRVTLWWMMNSGNQDKKPHFSRVPVAHLSAAIFLQDIEAFSYFFTFLGAQYFTGRTGCPQLNLKVSPLTPQLKPTGRNIWKDFLIEQEMNLIARVWCFPFPSYQCNISPINQ